MEVMAKLLKIGDFGIAKNIAREAAQTIIGTQLYMAPEVLRGGVCGFECDIWTAAIILFQMITNGFPFDLRDHMRFIREINHGIDGRVPNNVSPPVTYLLNSSVHKDAPRRPSTGRLIHMPIIAHAIGPFLLNMSLGEKAIILNP